MVPYVIDLKVLGSILNDKCFQLPIFAKKPTTKIVCTNLIINIGFGVSVILNNNELFIF